jgi:Holliday junction DNA helicase RuvA
MIGSLKGKVVSREQNLVVVDVGGVGFEVFLCSQDGGAQVLLGDEVSLLVRTVVREDSITLYGFFSLLERKVFDLLMTVSGIGPRLAMTILCNISAEDFVRTVRANDTRRLCAIPGVGAKTAERILLEMKGKVKGLDVEMTPFPSVFNDLRLALLELGYAPRDVEVTLRDMGIKGDERLEDLIPVALQRLMAR